MPERPCLIEGTGGVALFGLQIAKARGARVIIVSGSADKLERAKALGADQGIDRSSEDWVEAVYRLTADQGADHILELVGGAHLGKAVRAAAIGGPHLPDRRAGRVRRRRPPPVR